MKTLSKIQKLTTVGFLAIVLTFGMFFSAPAHKAEAQSQSSAQQMILSLLAQIQELQTLLAQLEGGEVTTSSAISIGDTVQVNGTRLSVRTSASGLRLGVAEQGAVATVVGGPQRVDGYTWWKLDYQTGPDGWSAGDWLRVRSSANADGQSAATTQKDTRESSVANSSTGAEGTLKVSVVGAGLEINVASDITKAAAQEMCSANLNAWRIQYSMRFGDKAIQCDWQSGGDRWSKAVAVKDGKAVDTVAIEGSSDAQGTEKSESTKTAEQMKNQEATLSTAAFTDGDKGKYTASLDSETEDRNFVVEYKDGVTNEYAEEACKIGIPKWAAVFNLNHRERFMCNWQSAVDEDDRWGRMQYVTNKPSTRPGDEQFYDSNSSTSDEDASYEEEIVEEEEDVEHIPASTEGRLVITLMESGKHITSKSSINRSDAREYCYDNLGSWIREYEDEYEGDQIRCQWDSDWYRGQSANMTIRMPLAE
jgi:hypothetical protein